MYEQTCDFDDYGDGFYELRPIGELCFQWFTPSHTHSKSTEAYRYPPHMPYM